MADQPDANPHPQSARTLATLDDLRAGRQPQEIARTHGVSRQWVHLIRKRAVKVRRDRIADPLVDRQSAVTYGIALRPYRVQPDGWVRIGGVTDRVAGVVVGVFWHPETGGLRMQRPAG